MNPSLDIFLPNLDLAHPNKNQKKSEHNEVEEVNSAQRCIRLSGVDLVDGTPVLDVKPYVPDYDCPRTRDTRDSAGTDADADSGVRVAVRFYFVRVFFPCLARRLFQSK